MMRMLLYNLQTWPEIQRTEIKHQNKSQTLEPVWETSNMFKEKQKKYKLLNTLKKL